MKAFLKENLFSVLFVILLGLMFLLWSRLLFSEFFVHATQKNLETTADRVRCVQAFGWQIDETSETEETVYIPKTFDAVWERYNTLQKMSGFDLSAYRGTSAKRYTYRALYFPGVEDAEVFIHILVVDGTFVGGDCMTVALDGFMLPIDIRNIS